MTSPLRPAKVRGKKGTAMLLIAQATSLTIALAICTAILFTLVKWTFTE